MIQAVLTLSWRRIRRGTITRVAYFLHYGFSRELVDALGWKKGDKLATSINHIHGLKYIEIRPAKALESEIGSYLEGPAYTLGEYKDRGSLWLDHEISQKMRHYFLQNHSNGVAVKVCWKPSGAAFSCKNGVLHLYGAGEPFRKGVTRRKPRMKKT